LTSAKKYVTNGAHLEKEEMSMAKLDYRRMTWDAMQRLSWLTDYEQQAVAAIMEAEDYSIEEIEEALDIVENGNFEFYPEIFSMADLARELVEEGCFGKPKAMGELLDYVDYKKLGEDLRQDGYTETSLGIVRIVFSDFGELTGIYPRL